MPRTQDEKLKAEKVKEIGDTLVFRAKRPLSEEEFELLSNMVRAEEERSGVKIVLMPFSVDLVETGVDLLGENETGTNDKPDLETFATLPADSQRELLQQLQIEGDDSNEEKRVALYSDYLNKVETDSQQ